MEPIHANPTSVHIRYGDSCELTMLLEELVPCSLQTSVNEYSGTDTAIKEWPWKEMALPATDNCPDGKENSTDVPPAPSKV